jgi:hypothetical protein
MFGKNRVELWRLLNGYKLIILLLVEYNLPQDEAEAMFVKYLASHPQ